MNDRAPRTSTSCKPGSDLESAGTPVSTEQERKLVAALADFSLPAMKPAEPGEPMEHAVERFRTWRAERERLIRELARPVHTPEQRERMEESDALRAALQATIPRTFGVGTSSGPVAAPPAPRR